MGRATKIGWCDDTFNVWEGCEKVSPGCKFCYACERDQRWHDGKHWGKLAPRKPMSEGYWAQPLRWNREAEESGVRRRVFCSSLADVFEMLPAHHPSFDMQARARMRLWNLILRTPFLDWLLLTKRPENFARLLPWRASAESVGAYRNAPDGPWPNVWLGVTAENQEYADRRIPILLETQAALRFVSYEPALGPIDLGESLGSLWLERVDGGVDAVPGVDWVIAGAESGPYARPAELDWIRSVRDQCVDADVPFYFKQWVGAVDQGLVPVRMLTGGKKMLGPRLDGKVWAQVPEVKRAA